MSAPTKDREGAEIMRWVSERLSALALPASAAATMDTSFAHVRTGERVRVTTVGEGRRRVWLVEIDGEEPAPCYLCGTSGGDVVPLCAYHKRVADEWTRREVAAFVARTNGEEPAPTPSAPPEPQAWRALAERCDDVTSGQIHEDPFLAARLLDDAAAALRAAAETVEQAEQMRDEAVRECEHTRREITAQYARTRHAVLRFQTVCERLATAAGQPLHAAMIPNVTTEDAERWVAALRARVAAGERAAFVAGWQMGASASILTRSGAVQHAAHTYPDRAALPPRAAPAAPEVGHD